MFKSGSIIYGINVIKDLKLQKEWWIDQNKICDVNCEFYFYEIWICIAHSCVQVWGSMYSKGSYFPLFSKWHAKNIRCNLLKIFNFMIYLNVNKIPRIRLWENNLNRFRILLILYIYIYIYNNLIFHNIWKITFYLTCSTKYIKNNFT